MAKTRKITRAEMWSAEWVFVLAVSGAAIGLNNVWQFPYLAGQHGGGAFIIVYLVCVLLIGFPLLISEALLGRAGRRSPPGAIRELSRQSGVDPNWSLVGWLVVFAGFLVFSYLSVIASWTLAYAVRSATGTFEGLTADGVGSLFSEFVRDPEKQLFWHGLFLAMTMVAAARGVRQGLEPVIKFAMPAMLAMLFILFLYASTLDAFAQAAEFILQPDFSRLTAMGVLAAMGHAFFSLGLGAGAVMIYGAHLSDRASIPRASLLVAIIDTLVGLVAGIAIFSILFAGGMGAAAGPELLFKAAPVAFDNIAQGRLMPTLFYAMLLIIAWMTAIALVEPALVWARETFDIARSRVALYCGLAAWGLGVLVILSFNDWAFSFKFFGAVKKLGFFDAVQILTSNFLLPIGGMLVAIFSGWMVKREVTAREIGPRLSWFYGIWLWVVRLVVPFLLLIVVLNIRKLFQ